MKRQPTRATAVVAAIAGALLAASVPAVASAAPPVKPDDRANHGVGIVAIEQATGVVRPDDRAGPKGPGLAATVTTAGLSHPDNRANHGVGATAATAHAGAARPDDRSTLRGPGAIATPLVVRTDPNRFDWDDVAVGAFGGVGLTLLLVGGVALLATRRTGARVVIR